MENDVFSNECMLDEIKQKLLQLDYCKDVYPKAIEFLDILVGNRLALLNFLKRVWNI